MMESPKVRRRLIFASLLAATAFSCASNKPKADSSPIVRAFTIPEGAKLEPPAPATPATEIAESSESPSTVEVTAAPAPVAAAPAPVAAAPTPVAIKPAAVTSALLTESIHDGLTGLPTETPARQASLRARARELSQLREKKHSAMLRDHRVGACQEDEPADATDAVFCRLTLKVAGVTRKIKATRNKDRNHAQTVARLVKALRNADTAPFAGLTDQQTVEPLKKIHNSVEIRPMIERALLRAETPETSGANGAAPKGVKSGCPSTALLTGLGMKSEENFPDPDWKDLSMALYQRSGECGNDASALKGLYRLGLMQIWNHKWEEAETSFARLYSSADAVDFRSRVLYWRHFAAVKRNDSKLRDQLREELMKDHPMSLHGLIAANPTVLRDGGDEKAMAAVAAIAPRVTFRSTLKPSLNASIIVAEALQAEGARDLSLEALAAVADPLRSAEPEVQLYAGLLFTRSGDTLNKFKLLAGLFRDYPMLIARESLELLYPLQRFEIVRGYESQADPFLVISLIRQESAFNERARSRVGAMGLMQLMPQTARLMERVSKMALFDPKTNIRLGVRFFSRLTERYGGDVEMALAAYNAGPEKVDTWLQRYPVDNRLLFVDLIPFRETREYVASIARNYVFYKRLYANPERLPATHLPASAPVQPLKSPTTGSPFKLFDT